MHSTLWASWTSTDGLVNAHHSNVPLFEVYGYNVGNLPSLLGFPFIFFEVRLNVFYSSFSFFVLCISQVISTMKPLTILCFMVEQLSLLMTVFRVNLLNLLCQGFYNIINRNYMCKPVMHQMKLNPFKPGWLPLHIVFHHCLYKINGFGDNTIPYYFREKLYLKVTVGCHQHLDLTSLQADWI